MEPKQNIVYSHHEQTCTYAVWSDLLRTGLQDISVLTWSEPPKRWTSLLEFILFIYTVFWEGDTIS